MSKNKVRVLIVDDSAMVRKLLSKILSSDKDIEVVGSAMDAYMARDRIKKLNPDVLTLDVEMPKMDGVTFLKNLMRLRPMPVIMVSTLTEKGAEVTLDALSAGAVDFVTKPKIDLQHNIDDYAEEIISKVKAAARARVRAKPTQPMKVQDKYSADDVLGERKKPKVKLLTTDKMIAIGASTGGTEAIREVLCQLPASMPAIVIAQHIPPKFSAAFAERADACCAIRVKEAEDGELIVPGSAYVAPGHRHLLVVRDGVRWKCKLSDDLPVNRHKPSVDVLFRSVSENVGPNALGLILTGMGKDGAQGLKDMLEAGAHTIAQDEASSVVWGMPGAAVEIQAAKEVLPLKSIPDKLISRFR
ncbi:MAG: chemotaxis response regulator protein-glutamate methylesterase [Gammaproteobacteria bacterium]